MASVTRPRFRLSLLGDFELTGPDGPIELNNRKLAGLLAFMACTAGKPQSREKLTTLLWGSHFETQARQNLRQALLRLRRVLGHDALIGSATAVWLLPSLVACDVARFEALIRDGGRGALAKAADLYKGQFLADVAVPEEAWADWVRGERQRFDALAVDAMIRLAEQELELGHREWSLVLAKRAVSIDNLREDAHRRVITGLVALGRRADALKHYNDLASLLQRELGVDPDAATVALKVKLCKSPSISHFSEPTSGGSPSPHERALPLADRASTASSERHEAADLKLSPDHVPQDVAEKLDLDVQACERKHVTLLCADIKESLEPIAERDPEQALRILDAVLKLMRQAVHRYEGTVIVEAGDGITAVFGVPVAQEDHAVRACYAALQIDAAVKRYAQEPQNSPLVPVMVRAGLNSGEVVVRSIGCGLHAEYRVMGQTTHLAARLGQIAALGTLLVSAATLRLAEGHVQARPLQSAQVTGPGGPVYELVGAGSAQTRFQVLAARGLTCFVGRDPELEQLRRVQQLAGKGDGQVAAVVGEAGVGKSRLIYEFTRSHRLLGWQVLEASSVSYGKATSYGPVIDLLQGYFKIQERDDLRQIREQVTGKLLSLDCALEATLPELLSLLDLPVDDAAWLRLDPRQRRQRTLDAVKRLLLREARERPLLVIFEDLHWIDSETQALLDCLVDSVGSARLLLLVSYRPEYQHAWMTRTHYSQLRLDALLPESADQLLNALLGEDPGLAPLKQVLIKRGSPFFLEETVRTLIETKVLAGERGHYRLVQPVQAIQVPPTVQAMLAARIDRLPPEDKHLLQTASVVGKDVPLALLEPIAELPEEALRRGLDRLRAAGFVYETGLFPQVEYSFKHALTHEVTYAGLLRERRRELHARIVDVLETLHPDRLSGEIERLAHHALRGELWERAIQYLRQAAAKAAARSALPQAQNWFEQALGALNALPESQSTLEQAFEIRLDLRPVLTLRSEFRAALGRLREAEVLAERLNNDSRRGRVYAFMTNTHTQLGERDDAVVTGSRALQIAERLGDLQLRIISTTYLAQAHYYHGDYERVVELASDNLASLPADWVSERFGLPTPASIYARWLLLPSLAHLGRFAETAQDEVELIRLAEPTQHAYTIGETYQAVGLVRLIRGDWTGACSRLEHAHAALRNGNVLLPLPPTLAAAAWALAQLGEEDEALKRVRETEQLLEHHAARGLLTIHRWACRWLGRACLQLGRLDDARRLGNRALEFLPPQTGLAAHTFHLLGDIATHPDRFDAESGETHYARALALAEPRGMRPLVARCHFGLGRLYRKIGRREEARAALSQSVEMLRDMHMTFWLSQAEAELDRLIEVASHSNG
jgi:DNA-binding SARP family transcriptional activator/class 3 adenylate cyclase